MGACRVAVIKSGTYWPVSFWNTKPMTPKIRAVSMPGNRTAKDLDTPEGTLSGILISIFPLRIKAENSSAEPMPTIRAMNIPWELV